MEEQTETLSNNCCTLCGKPDHEVELIEIESNSLKYGEIIVEFADLLFEVFQIKIDKGLICSECQQQVIHFYYYKNNVQFNLDNLEWNQRSQIIKKLDMFLDDFDYSEDLAVLRYNQCFAVVPESKRGLMQNFQNWQPRVSIEKIVEEVIEKEEHAAPICIVSDIETNAYDDFIVEDVPDYASEIIEETYEAAEEIAEEDFTEPPAPKRFKPTRSQREWVNKTTKSCYSVEETSDGTVPIWTCLFCGKVYKSSQALRLHLLAKHLDDEDDEMESLTDELKEWLRQEHRDRRVLIESIAGDKFEWTCGICEFMCTSSKTFRAHMIKTHINETKPSAPEIKEKMRNCTQQQWSLRIEPDEETWKSPNHELSFRSVKSFKEDRTADHCRAANKSGTPRPRKLKVVKFQWTCNECLFQFSAQRSFDSHMKLHETLRLMNPSTEIFHCGECRMFFKSIDDLATHTMGHAKGQLVLVPAEGMALQKTILYKRLIANPDVESEEGDSTCGHCGRKMSGTFTCKSHLLIHHVNPLICPKEGRQFNSMQSYLCHLQKVHSDIFPQSLQCTHCAMSFDNIYERLAHMKICDEKKFICDHCDKKFSSKNYLNNHLKRELGLLSCSCQICGKVVKAKDELKIHMRSHTKEKPFKCTLCDKSYTTTSARASHMETHKDTVIQCEICAVKFIARRHYVVHYKRYHDEAYRQRKFDEQTCLICAKQFLRKDRLREHMQKVHAFQPKQESV